MCDAAKRTRKTTDGEITDEPTEKGSDDTTYHTNCILDDTDENAKQYEESKAVPNNKLNNVSNEVLSEKSEPDNESNQESNDKHEENTNEASNEKPNEA